MQNMKDELSTIIGVVVALLGVLAIIALKFWAYQERFPDANPFSFFFR
jgi:hypothetical protein